MTRPVTRPACRPLTRRTDSGAATAAAVACLGLLLLVGLALGEVGAWFAAHRQARAAADLAALVKEKTKAGWQFVFLGAGLDAFNAARSAGVRIDWEKTIQYDRGSSRDVFHETAKNSREFLKSRRRDSLNYSQAQRAKVRDKRATEKGASSQTSELLVSLEKDL